jgi:hypothetical protein
VGGVTYDGSRTHMRQELRELKKKKKNRLRGMFVISLSLSLSCIYIQASKEGRWCKLSKEDSRISLQFGLSPKVIFFSTKRWLLPCSLFFSL